MELNTVLSWLSPTFIVSAVVAFYALKFSIWYLFPYYIPDIPVQKANNFFGFSSNVDRYKGKFDSHARMYEHEKKMGKLFQYYTMGYHVIMVNDKFVGKYILEHVVGKGIFHRGHPKINHKSIFNLNTGEEWKQRRVAFRQSFTTNNLRNFTKELQTLSTKCMQLLERAAVSKEVIQIDKLFGQLTIDVICTVAFQFDINALENSEMFQTIHRDLDDRLQNAWISILPFADKLIHLPLKVFDQYKRGNTGVKKFCKMLLDHLRDLDKKGELHKECFGYSVIELSKTEGITDEDLGMEIFTMFVAGHDTTAHSLSWFIYSLATHPDIQKKCHQAVDSQLQDISNSTSTAAAKTQMATHLPVYVEAVLKECMRKYSVANRGSTRMVSQKEGITIPKEVLNRIDPNVAQFACPNNKVYTKDVHIPYGTWFQVFFANLHASQSNWGENALEFIPERWLPEGHYTGDSKLKNDSTTTNPLSSAAIYGGGGVYGDDLAFTPFSYGIRNCIGMNLAMMELRIVIADLVKSFEFSLADEAMKDEAVVMETVFTLRPKDMLPVYVTKRATAVV